MLTCCGLKVWWSIENLLVILFVCYASVPLSVLTKSLLWKNYSSSTTFMMTIIRSVISKIHDYLCTPCLSTEEENVDAIKGTEMYPTVSWGAGIKYEEVNK